MWKRHSLLKIAGVLLFCFISNLLVASDNNGSWIDTTEIKLGKSRIFFVSRSKADPLEKDSLNNGSSRHHWRGIDLGYAGYLINGKLVNLSSGEDQWELVFYRSTSLGLNLVEKRFSLKKDLLDIVTGVGFNFTTYFFKNNVDLIASDTQTYVSAVSTDPGQAKVIKRNKLKITYAEVPLLLEMHAKKGRSFHAAFGFIGGLRLGSKYKQSYTIDKTKHKEKRSDDFNINPFRVNSTVRCGYGNFTLFANYGITELFVSNKTSYELTPISLGISLLGF